MIFHFALLYKLEVKSRNLQVVTIFRGLDSLLGKTKESRCRKCKENSSTIAFHCRTKRIWTILMLSWCCLVAPAERKSVQITESQFFAIPKWLKMDFLEIQEKSFWAGERLRFRDFVFEVAGPPQKNHAVGFFTAPERFPTFSLFCAPREFHETLLYVVEERKVPFRVRRPGARIGLSPRRNSRSALPRAIPIFAFSLKRCYSKPMLCETPSWRGPESSEKEHLLL